VSSQIQTIIALLVVALAAAWLIARAVGRRGKGSCGDDCGAVSPEIRKLQARLKKSR
jgi:hypothetical protein